MAYIFEYKDKKYKVEAESVATTSVVDENGNRSSSHTHEVRVLDDADFALHTDDKAGLDFICCLGSLLSFPDNFYSDDFGKTS